MMKSINNKDFRKMVRDLHGLADLLDNVSSNYKERRKRSAHKSNIEKTRNEKRDLNIHECSAPKRQRTDIDCGYLELEKYSTDFGGWVRERKIKLKKNIVQYINDIKCEDCSGYKYNPISITSTQFPRILLTREQIDMIKDFVMGNLINKSDDEFKPHIKGVHIETGYIMFLCANIETTKWLKDFINNSLFEEMMLKAVNGDAIGKLNIINGKFADFANIETEKIFRLIEMQNSGLDVNNWVLLSRKDTRTTTHLVVAVSDRSIRKLKALRGQISVGVGQVNLTYHSKLLEKYEN